MTNPATKRKRSESTDQLISLPSSGRVLCVGGGALVHFIIALEQAQYQVSKMASAASEQRLLTQVSTFIPDLILVNLPRDDERGLELLELLAFDPRTNRTPLIAVVEPEAEEPWLIEAYGRSSCDFLRSDVTPTELLARVQLLLRLGRPAPPRDEPRELIFTGERAANDATNAAAFRDPETGLSTPEYLYHRISSEVTRARRYERNLSVLAIRCPEATSPSAREQVAVTLRAMLRRPDVVAHIESLTWIALLPEADVQSIEGLMERLRRELEPVSPCAFGRSGLDRDGAMGAHGPDELIAAARDKCEQAPPR